MAGTSRFALAVAWAPIRFSELMPQRICRSGPPTSLDLDFHREAGSVLAFHVTPSLSPRLAPGRRGPGSTGILTRFPSATPFGLALGID